MDIHCIFIVHEMNLRKAHAILEFNFGMIVFACEAFPDTDFVQDYFCFFTLLPFYTLAEYIRDISFQRKAA